MMKRTLGFEVSDAGAMLSGSNNAAAMTV